LPEPSPPPPPAAPPVGESTLSGRLVPEPSHGRGLKMLVVGAIGVVYGDIGTSPLYTIEECFNGHHRVGLTGGNILGVLSLIFWSLIITISLKYVWFILRADNRGEGGELALMALALRRSETSRFRKRALITVLGLFGASLLYGDGMITPAITVLSAVEGLQVVAPALHSWVVPIAVGILVGLFLIQSRGTAKIGTVFGPLLLVWFGTLAILGVRGILMFPDVLAALNPWHAVQFFLDNGWVGFVALSSVFLAVTGGEALYADMGHFGRRPIRWGWYSIVLPSLVLNYLGQGGLLLSTLGDAEAAKVTSANPFFLLAPSWAMAPLVVLATMSAAVASQAVISGAFSMTRQAVQLGYMPRLEIKHTSSHEIGQIYVPQVNWMLAISTIVLVVTQKSATNLAGAYGMAVSLTMVLTTVLTFFVARAWNWRRRTIVLVFGFFLLVDVAFFAANATKLFAGGWFPLLVGLIAFTLMTTWRRGRDVLGQRLEDRAFPLDSFIKDVAAHPPVRVPGISIFMSGSVAGTPVALLHNVKNNKVLHEKVVVLQMRTEEVPHVRRKEERVAVETLDQGFYRVTAQFGFMDTPDVQEVVATCREMGFDWPAGKSTFFLGRTTLLPTSRPGMARWRKALFIFMSRNAERATAYFNIPPGRVVELGMQVEL
jgi:KUP system potassium uptake protein